MIAADRLFYLVADGLTIDWITGEFPNAISLFKHYAENKPRLKSYNDMVAEVLMPAAEGLNVCCAFYGHPSIFVYPSHKIYAECKARSIAVEIYPGISADACLYADLSIDPAKNGMLSFEATDFLVYNRPFSRKCGLLLWQVGVIGDLYYHKQRDPTRGLRVLVERLSKKYSMSHNVILYEASTLPLFPPKIYNSSLSDLPATAVSAITTMYVPPERPPKLNKNVITKLGLDLNKLKNISTAVERNR